MSKSPESDLMNNLSANEKRRLMRHIAEGSPKKKNEMTSLQNEQTTTSRNYNQTPKPFGAKAPASSTSSSKFKNVAPVKQNSFVAGKPIKPVNSSNNNVSFPKLNPANVEMFMAKENESKSKGKPNVRNTTPVPYKPVPKYVPKSDPVPKNVINKVNEPKPKVSSSRPLVTSSASVQNKSNFEHSSAKDKAPIAPKKVYPPKPAPNPKIESKVSKSPASRPSSAANNQQSSQSQKKPPTAVITPIVKPSSAKPPSVKKTSAKKPPTAVISPIVKPTSAPVKQKSTDSSKKTETKSRQRSVSEAVVTKVPENKEISVSYNAAGDNVNVPVSAPKEKPRSHSDTTPGNDIVPLSAKASATVMLNLGHNFQPHELKDWVNWCDACGSVILSLFGKCVSCTKCKMVCHAKCTLTVSLTCEADQPPTTNENEELPTTLKKTIVEETTDEATLKEYNTIHRTISVDEIQQRIEEFNATVKGSQQMTLQEDGETFRGFIRVSMNLTRPVCVQDSSKTSRKPVARKSSFYIDKGALKALHLTSGTTAEQVVFALLHKYSISDNPMKFALFEKQMREEGHVILRKMLPKERPLFLRLLWGNGDSDKRGFILQENESRDIQWESFSVGELYMFIKILDKEEADYVLEIKRKFKNKAQDIKNAIQYHNKKNKESK